MDSLTSMGLIFAAWIGFSSAENYAARNKTKCFPGNINNNNLQLEGSSGTFESPFYPSKYPKSINCTWVITVPYGKLVKLSFSAFDVEWSSSCDEDYVQIYDGWSSASEVKTKLCGASLPSDVSSTSRYLRVQFRSDEDNHGNCSGFKAQFEQVHKANVLTILFIGGVSLFLLLICMACSIIRRRRSPTPRRQFLHALRCRIRHNSSRQFLRASTPQPAANLHRYPPSTMGYRTPSYTFPMEPPPPYTYPTEPPPPYPGEDTYLPHPPLGRS
ncbi:hypothetical protein pdam_00014418 [Pocillopora damicornis]|uniref:CUB domain-containing protein n=1 Tax=Pocillopora damicornis TaxID=46731 RepID=A0A3M6U893_POCDA|nr:hypothetical protein pdam_00014418 [Pocillopora damicornis]